MRAKLAVARGIPDLALGCATTIIALAELKGPHVRLDVNGGHRGRRPVQQAWDCANDVPGAPGLSCATCVSCTTSPLATGSRTTVFDLSCLDEEDELASLQLLLHAEWSLTGTTAALLERSASADAEIADQLSATYKSVCDDLLHFVADDMSASR